MKNFEVIGEMRLPDAPPPVDEKVLQEAVAKEEAKRAE